MKHYCRYILLLFVLSPAICIAAYSETKAAIEARRLLLAQTYQASDSAEEKSALLSKAGLELQKIITSDLAPHWYGTPWSFSGTSQIPGEGSIACGYFVTTLLRDAGFNLERVKLAQQASENIIKALVLPASIKRFSGKPLDRFLNDARALGNGIYIVGLDYHVGFISVEESGAYFIHSSYQEPFAVVRESAQTSQILADSRYRVIGKLADEKLLIGWLTQQHFVAR